MADLVRAGASQLPAVRGGRLYLLPGGVRFLANTGFLDEVLRAGWLDDELEDVAERAADEARAIARAEFYRHGGYLRGIGVAVGTEPHLAGRGAGRVVRVGALVARDYKSWWAEAGFAHYSHGRPTGRRIPGKRVLERGMRRAGLAVRPARGGRAA